MPSFSGLKIGLGSVIVICLFPLVVAGLPVSSGRQSEQSDSGSVRAVQVSEPGPGNAAEEFEFNGLKSSSANRLARAAAPDESLAEKATGRVDSRKPAATNLLARWPKPNSILQRLEELEEFAPARPWATETGQLLNQLHENGGLNHPSSLQIIGQLQNQLQTAALLATELPTQPEYWPSEADRIIQLRRTMYGIQKRVEIWPLVHALKLQSFTSLSDTSARDVRHLIQASSQRVSFNDLGDGWSEYLMFDVADRVFQPTNPDKQEQKTTARKILARLHSPVLNPAQRQFLDLAVDPGLIDFLKARARHEFEPGKLVHLIEHYEAQPGGALEQAINDQYQNLLWSSNPLANELAAKLQTHYRNANFRVSISERMLNRMVPEIPDSEEPVSENILGAKVFGHSQISNAIQVRLIPDPDNIHLSLESNGRVRSRTLAQKSGFTVHNEGNARFKVLKEVTIGKDGVWSDRPTAVSSTNNRMLSIRGKLDPVPVVGWVARRIAKKQIDAQQPQANHYVRERLEESAETRMEQEVEQGLSELRQQLFHNLNQPLISMDLEPVPVQMATTDDQLVMRYRIGGRDQMAAFTSRPSALENSLMSFQAHQSLVNNLMMRMQLADRKFTPVELTQHVQQVLGTKPADTSKLEGIDAELHFSRFDPIRVDFRDNKIVIGLNFKRLRVNRSVWKNLDVSCGYEVGAEGLELTIQQDDDGIHLKGKGLRLRDRAAVLAIFGELFKNDYRFSTIQPEMLAQIGEPGIAISQLTIADGWLSISIGDDTASNQAARRVFGRRR